MPRFRLPSKRQTRQIYPNYFRGGCWYNQIIIILLLLHIMTYWYKWYGTLTFGDYLTLSRLPATQGHEGKITSYIIIGKSEVSKECIATPTAQDKNTGMPAEDAAEAPPILNEWVLIFADGKTRCNIADNLHRVRNEPFSNMNNGPDRDPLR